MPFPRNPENVLEIDEADATSIDFASVDRMSAVDALGRQSTRTARVLHLINGEHYSGAERVQDLLAKRLPTNGFDVGFVCVKPGKFSANREARDAPLTELPMRGRFDLRVVKTIARLIENEGYELIHAHTPRTALVGRLAARRASVPLLYHVHSPAGSDSTRRLANGINSLVERLSLAAADRLIAVSPALRAYMIERGFRPERVVCVPNGVPLLATAVDRQAPSDEWTLGVVALFRPRKGIEVLLEALAQLRSRGVPVRLRAVGGFESRVYESSILALAEQLGLADAIEWIGFTRNVNRELEQIDVLALPSLFGEGLPMVVLEAMAAGVPIIASRVDGVNDAVQHRKTGLLCQPGSARQLAGAIEELIAGAIDYTSLSRCARQRHAERFSDVAMAAGVAKVYRDVLSAHGAQRAIPRR